MFPAATLLEFVAFRILAQLLTTKRVNQFLLVITDRFSNLVSVVSLKNILEGTVAEVFVNIWVLVYGPPKWLFSDSASLITSKFFRNVGSSLGVTNVFMTMYHRHCNKQVSDSNE